MKILKTSLALFSLLLIYSSAFAQSDCGDDTEIVLVSGGSQTLCNGDGEPNILRFTTLPRALPTAYCVVDENDIIVYLNYSNFIDFELLPVGNLRVFSVGSNGTTLLAEVGDNYLDTQFTPSCTTFSENIITIRNLRPDGGTVATTAGETAIRLCVSEDVVNVVQFQTTSTDDDYIYLVTDDNNVLLSTSSDGSVDFSGAPEGVCRVWGLSLFDGFTGNPGQSAAEILENNACASLSSNFVEVTRLTPEGGTISFADGSSEFVSCTVVEPTGNATLQLSGNNENTEFTYVFVDASNNIVSRISASNQIDLAALPIGRYLIYGLSYTGNLTVAIGQNFDADNLSDECADLSDSPLTLIKRVQHADDILLADGSSETTVCVGDGQPDLLTFNSTYTGTDNLIYIITNAGNLVLGTSTSNEIDFEGAGTGICRVWTAVYSGNLILEAGQNLGTDAVSDECYDLSDGFVTITRRGVQGGQIAYDDGSTEFISCTPIAPTGTLTLVATGNDSDADYTYVLVNTETNTVADFFPSGNIDLATLPLGNYLVYGLSYTGNLTVMSGQTFDANNLSDECADLAETPLTLIKRVQHADDVLLADGSSQTTICVGDGQPDLLTFNSTYTGADNLIYIITDESNLVLGTSTSNEIDFEGAGAGICRVWTAAYSGNLILEAGQNLGEVAVSDECYDLSDGFVTINRNGPEGGQIAYADGGTEFISCTPLPPTGTLILVATGNDPNADYTYVLVNTETNTVADFFPGGSIDLAILPVGNYLVYGLSYTGNLTVMSGQTFDANNLSDQCADLAEAPLTLIKRIQNADDVLLADGSSQTTVCVGDGQSDLLTFNSTYTGADNLIYIITDAGNFVLDTSTSNEIDFEGAGAGICRVWTAAYSGNLILEAGQNLGTDAVSDECYDLSDGFVAITRIGVQGGQIAYDDGGTEFISCTPLAPTGTLTFVVTGSNSDANYTYVLVDTETNTVADFFPGGSIDLAILPVGNYLVYGLSYTGNLTVMSGQTFDANNLSDQCADLAEAPLTLIKRIQNADDVLLADGSSQTTVCVGDGQPDLLTFNSNYTGADNLIYIITDAGNFVLDTSTSNEIDFEGAGAGICRVWTAAYSGNLILEAGQNLGEVAVSDECYDLSDGFVTINRNGPEGGQITYADGSTEFLSCTPTGPTGSLTVVVTGNDPNADYAYVLVNTETNTIVDIFTDGSIDLANLPNGSYQLYGFSYLGTLTAAAGDTFDANALTSDCGDLADNSLSLIRRVQVIESVTLADGSSSVTICVGDGVPDPLTFTNSYSGDDTFTYVITDDNNTVLNTSTSPTIDFDPAGIGICRVWGLAYSGNLTVMAGETITSDSQLSDECFALSQTFVTVNRNGPEGGSISFADGSTTFLECQTSTGTSLELTVTGASTNLEYAYVVVNSDDGLVAAIVTGNILDLATLPLGNYEVYGVSYLGSLTIMVGDVFGDGPMANDCFDLSDNVLQLTNRLVSVGAITLENGNTSASICPNDGTPDVLSFLSDYTGSDNLVFLVTDENNTVIEILAAPSSDFDEEGPALVRVWAVAYSGNFLLQPGITITGDTQISDECFDLSDNFVLIDRDGPSGGTVSLADGSDAATTCSGDDVADLLDVSTTGIGSEYVYVVTTDENIILNVSTSPTIDFEGAPAGVCRIWGLAYGGNLTAMAGDNAAEIDLADGCFSLSDNFITVTRLVIDGGTVSLTDGTVQTFACGGDGEADFFEFTNLTTAADASYGYIITDDNNNILGILDGNGINLDEAAPGICRVWGLSYTGDITADVGENAAEVALTDGCFELSENFVTIDRQRVDGGDVTLADGSSTINICPNDNFADVLTFVNDGSTTASYAYAITDTDNTLLNYLQGDSFDFNEAILPTEIRVWGVAFSGLRSPVDGNLQTSVLSNQCFDVSDSFVTIIREEVAGGTVSTDEGATNLTLCTDDGMADSFTFIQMGASNSPYIYLVTDGDNNILEVLTDTDNFDFEGAPRGECRVWGLAYTGELLATAGMDAAAAALSDDCFALSENFITVNRDGFAAGLVTTIFLDNEYSTCPSDGIEDPISLLRNGNAGNNATFVYLLADENGLLLETFATDEFSFETLAEGVYRIYSFAYSGAFPLADGTDLTTLDLSDSCADLSDNFVTVNNFNPAAGTITANGGQGAVTICAGDNNPDLVSLEVDGAGNASYIFIVVDTAGNIVGLLDDPVFDFENASAGVWRIFGMSYTGSLLAFPGGNLIDELASSCYELTDTFVLLDKTFVDGGEVFTDQNQRVLYVCAGDGVADIVNFVNSSAATQNYRYLLTDDNNTFLSSPTGNSFDFETAVGLSRLRMWGASFAGELLLNIGENVTTNPVSASCGVLSNSFVDIFIGQPEGGTLSLPDGTDSGRLCHGNSRPGVFVQTTSNANVGYAYLLTDLNNNVLAVSEHPDGLVSFDDVDPGTYRIWAVSYTGLLLVQAGDNAAEVVLSSSCFALSDNFLTIERTESLDAGNVSSIEDEEEVYFCPADGQPDLLVFQTDSEETSYRYLITDTLGNILITDIESNVINFDIAPAGACRLYGIAFTGTFDPPSDGNIFTDALSTDCWVLSNNFILIIKQQPEGGTVSTVDGETEVEVNVGDNIPDIYNFSNTGIELTPYIYVVTDDNNIIIGFSDVGEVDFEGASPGTCRVWGLSYTGNVLVGTGDNAATSILTDDCFDLSDNFVTVIRTAEEGLQPEDSDEWEDQWTNGEAMVLLRPNPVVDILSIEITINGNATSSAQRLDVFDVNGLLVRSLEVGQRTETYTANLDVSLLQAGLYLLRWQNGEEVIVKRFIKQD